MTNMQSLIRQTLGQYKIIDQIGEGGMATVFKAYQPGLNREVALKVLPPYVAQKEGFTERFTREAQAIGNLHHPNILPVYDSGQDKGFGYIAMRYIPKANTLAHLMRKSLKTEQIIQLTEQIAGALDHAHQSGIIHRDVKPSNILMDGDWVLLSDFGLAKMIAAPSELTGTGVGIGTPAYMSPEQAKGEKIDHRTDIYSLGIILFEMLTGQVPHKAETPLATAVKRINEPLPSPRSLNPDIPEAVEQVLLKALAMAPAQRYDSAGEMATALQTAFESIPAPALANVAKGTAFSVQTPSDVAQAQAVSPGPISQPDQVPAQMPPPKSTRAMDIVALTLLGAVSLCGIGGVFLSFIPDAETDQMSFELAPACMGMTFAGLTSMLMIWLRDKRRQASAALAMGIVLWFIGVNILGWGGFAVLSPGDDTFVENLGFSLALCFAPGGFLALLGLIIYGYDYRRSRQTEIPAHAQVTASTEAKRNRADKLRRAAEYRAYITGLIKQKKGSPLASQLTPITTKLDRWEAHLRQLVNRLDNFETNHIIQRDIHDVPAAITQLKAQMETETNAQVRAEMAETLASYQEHQRQLDSLITLMRRTELDVDETVAAIGAIYSQLQLLDARDIDSRRASRLSTDIDEQANRLSDLLAAMDDVYESSVSLR